MNLLSGTEYVSPENEILRFAQDDKKKLSMTKTAIQVDKLRDAQHDKKNLSG